MSKSPKDDFRGDSDLRRPQASLFPDSTAPIGLDEFQEFTTTTDRNPNVGIGGLDFVLLGLFGEVGSLLAELKKKQRDKDAYFAYHDSVIEELGDVLWYFSNAALRVHLPLSVLARRVPATLGNWDYQGTIEATTFVQLQKAKHHFSGPLSSDRFERRLLSLAGKVGVMLDDYCNGKITENRDVFSGYLIEIFRSLLIAADQADVSLDEAARRNIAKTVGRWPLTIRWPPLSDEDIDIDEQLPRRIAMTFKEKQLRGSTYVIQQLNGVNIGDRLTDNRVQPDDYRFHDVFHLAYAAVLGWSPVLRALLKVKRKSRPEIDENEDGARAQLIEEGVSAWIFNHGVRNSGFRNVTSLDYSLLKAVHELVKGYEVDQRPLWQWERAILEGFRMFRELCKHRGGTVTADLRSHTVEFTPPTE